ncbi:MAG: hypothetical protein HY517_01305, partial [Candidatus Aenigmarchaeota archaeon]|nr:hypothetical protein [Candidatus Aenigmarchaeota archaeon]
MNEGGYALVFLVILALSSTGFAASSYEIQLVVSKYVLGPNENVSITGYLRNISSNSTDNVTTSVNGGTITVSLINSTNSSLNTTTFATNENGTFFSRSVFNPSAQAMTAPNSSGTYTLLANYTAAENATSKATIVVADTKIDDIQFQLPRVNFYSSENTTITAKTVQKVGGSLIAVANVSLNITMRHTNESIINSYACTTGSSGTCSFNVTVPSAAGTYVFEANNFVGFTNFNVVPFDAEVYIKDSSSITYKNIFTKGESGFVEVRVSYNSTTPSGSYNATGIVTDASGNTALSLSSVLLNATNGFVDKISFTVTSSLVVGSYTAKIYVTKQGGDTVNATANFQVRDWSLTFNKAAKNSGFEYGYTTFLNTTMMFEAYPVERANGTVIENLTSNFTIALKNSLGTAIRNTTVRYNATCGAKPCYEFNLTMPDITGDYTLSVALNYSGDYQSSDRTLKSTDLTASAQPTDSEGSLKELFGTTEFIYISLSGKNKTSSINASDVEVASITYENGTKMSYGETNLSLMNLSDSALKWAWNSSSRRIVVDPPKIGGVYIIEMYANNKSAAVTTRFGIRPYDVCTSAKGSSDTTTSDYWYQFRTSDTIYFHIKISEAQNVAGKATASNASGFSSTYGRTSQCSFDSTKKRSINNATVTVESVLNTQSGKTEQLNATATTCSSVDNTGGYVCTVQAADGAWDGGRHVATIHVLGDDRETSSRGNGFFEARAFYLYGYSSNWANKANSSITLNINAYEAGSGWWNSASGLSGTAVIDSINYYGGAGEWIWPPIKSDYNVTGLNMTITNGVGSATLSPNRTKAGLWTGGYYSAVIRATINNQVDYGEAWFNIRNWDAYATPVEIRGTTFDTKSSVSTKQNVSLYVRITQAGEYSDYNGGRLLGNVTIKVKKVLDYSQNPAREINEGNFTANSININESSPWYTNANANTHSKYLINISSATGQWEPGYYSIILDVNSTETGYGWFNAISFYVNTQPTNSTGGGYVYNNKGNTPIYFNVTTTKSQKTIYTATDFVNATITEAVVRVWDQTTYTQREFKYPTEINITPLLVNGSGIINVSYLGGNWPSGWYYGEIKMKDSSDNSTAKGWVWFSVQPFRVSSSTTSYNVGTKQNVTVNININEPDWSNNALLNGNYTITSVEETSWSSGSYRVTRLNYTYNSTAGIFRNATTLTINPAGGKWKPGYKSGTITVKDNVTNDTQTAWFSFRATSFTDTVTRTSSANIGSNGNITVNITLSAPAGGSAAGNLSSAFYWGWPSKTRYRFKVGSCDSQTSTTCLINGSAIATILPPSGGWNEGYNYLYFEYVEPDDGTSVTESWSSVYFYVKQTISGYMHSVTQQGFWQNSFGQRENVTMFLYSLQNLTGGILTVNVTNVQVAKTSSNCWSDSCRSYSNATFQVINFSGNDIIGRTNITSGGYIRINASGDAWEAGDYAVKVFVTDTASGDSGVVKDATFRIIDKSAPTINITSPTAEQVINATSILFTATTSEQAVCYVNIYDYGTFDRNSCGTNSTNTSSFQAACNTTKYNNATTYYFSYAAKWWSYTGNFVSTDSTSHSYNHTTSSMTDNQNYTVKFECYDTDWNYATNATTFNLIGRGSFGPRTTNLTITISSPANATYSTSTLALNYTVNGTTSACWYELNGASNVTLLCNYGTLFTASTGTNRIRVYANNSAGTVFNSSTIFFTVNTSKIAISISSPANTTYTNSNVTINYTVNGTAYACWYRLNNNTNVTLIGCLNASLIAPEGSNNVTLYANNTNGTVFNSSTIFFTVNTIGLTINVSSPANTTYASTTVSLNYTVIGTPSQCWYRLNNNTNVSLIYCVNNTFTAANGTNNITVYANSTNGTVYNSSAIFFTVNATTNLTMSITSPANTTYTSTNISLNFTLSGPVSQCWYKLNGLVGTFFNCTNTTFTADDDNDGNGLNVINVYANNTAGTTFNFSEIFFTVDTLGPQITYVSPTPGNNSVVNASYLFVNLTLNELADVVRLELNGTNYTMTNFSVARTAWFRNHT